MFNFNNQIVLAASLPQIYVNDYSDTNLYFGQHICICSFQSQNIEILKILYITQTEYLRQYNVQLAMC